MEFTGEVGLGATGRERNQDLALNCLLDRSSEGGGSQSESSDDGELHVCDEIRWERFS